MNFLFESTFWNTIALFGIGVLAFFTGPTLLAFFQQLQNTEII